MGRGTYFARPDDTVRVEFDEGPLAGEWVQLRAAISKADQERLYGAMFTGLREETSDDGRPRRTMEADATRLSLARLRYWVRRWSLDNESDRGQPPSGKQLETLLPGCADQILAAIDRHEATLAEDAEVVTDPKLASFGTSADDSLTREPAPFGEP